MPTNTFTRRSMLRGRGAGSVMLAGVNKSVMAAETGQAVPRAAFFFHANGSHPGWAPTGSGTNFTLSPHLKPIGDAGVTGDVIILRDMFLARKNVAPPAPANTHHNPPALPRSLPSLGKTFPPRGGVNLRAACGGKQQRCGGCQSLRRPRGAKKRLSTRRCRRRRPSTSRCRTCTSPGRS
jgi:hypothetical protein